jgi:uncharacterized phiE125 gp8 family phage protein
MMIMSVNPGEAPVSLDEARGWLRLGASNDDAIIAGLIRAATNICEAFIGQWLMIRSVEEEAPVRESMMRLGKRPVVAVDSVTILSGDGGDQALMAAEYGVTIARDGTATVRIMRGDAARVRVGYRAGIADSANAIPEALRQGIIRMVAHLHGARDGGDGEPPAIITAMWQPWRRMGLKL